MVPHHVAKKLYHQATRDFGESCGFSIQSKKENWFWRLISKLLFFLPSAANYYTTIGGAVYTPQSSSEYNALVEKHPHNPCGMVFHEARHARDARKVTLPVFLFLYALPLPIGLLALLAFGGDMNWLWALAAFAPIPAFFRAWYEYRGYSTSMLVHYMLTGRHYPKHIAVHQFCNAAYYFMFPLKDVLNGKFGTLQTLITTACVSRNGGEQLPEFLREDFLYIRKFLDAENAYLQYTSRDEDTTSQISNTGKRWGRIDMSKMGNQLSQLENFNEKNKRK